jgi:hypothetical protein
VDGVEDQPVGQVAALQMEADRIDRSLDRPADAPDSPLRDQVGFDCQV